jgi:HEAT repeat protein
LLAQLENSDPILRQTAITALAGQIDEEHVRDALLRQFGHDDWRVRQAAVHAVARDASVSPEHASEGRNVPVRAALVNSLGDDRWRVRHAAVTAVAGLASDPRIRDALVGRMRDEKWEVAQAAVAALERSLTCARHFR